MSEEQAGADSEGKHPLPAMDLVALALAETIPETTGFGVFVVMPSDDPSRGDRMTCSLIGRPEGGGDEFHSILERVLRSVSGRLGPGHVVQVVDPSGEVCFTTDRPSEDPEPDGGDE